MSWPLRFRTDPEPWKDAQIGDCWYHPDWQRSEHPYPGIQQHFLNHQASRQYLAQWADQRPPIIVWLPPGFGFSPDEKYTPSDNSNTERNGWTVTGSIDDRSLVVSPSVNILGTYHGWINGGQVSDDVEGRVFA